MSARHVFVTMGTAVSIHADASIGAAVLDDVERVFARYDERFSLYRAESELSRIAAGVIPLPDASADVRDAYAQAIQWRTVTRGAFTPHRPDGVVDLSGIVKALAIRDAGAVLDAAGSETWALGCGGDILTRRAPSVPQDIGIVDPGDRDRMLTAIELTGSRRAVATSGVAERGEHVWGARADFAQVTVVADDIVTADVLATAILAGGRETCDELTAALDVDVLAVRRDGDVVASQGVRLAQAAT
jgi:thiamine biosynthesis lipoprotein